MQPSAASDIPRFRHLLYRYWFYDWLFRDVTRGSRLERASAWRHNQSCARWLPTYLRRWSALGVGCWLLGWALEPHAPVLMQLIAYSATSVSIAVDVVTLAAWIGLKTLPSPEP